MTSPVERLWKLVDRRSAEECWPFTGALSKGYGHVGVKVDGVWRNRKAHRLAYELMVGPIPEGLQIDHLCRNRACCNPAHLEPVTNRENSLRGEGLPAQHARKTHCAAGHEYTDDNTMTGISLHGWPTRECRTCYREAMRRRHAEANADGQHKCPDCGRPFQTRRGLTLHRSKFHGSYEHGTRSRYVSGCRCESCTRANREYGSLYSAATRRGELRDAGMVEAFDRAGVSDTGSPCIRWTLTAAGRGAA